MRMEEDDEAAAGCRGGDDQEEEDEEELDFGGHLNEEGEEAAGLPSPLDIPPCLAFSGGECVRGVM